MRAPSALVLLLLLQASLSYSDDTAQTFHDPNLSYSEYRPSWRASDTQSVRFDFRTMLTDAMLVRHIVNTTISASQYTMGVALRKGQLQAMHVYGPHSDMILLGKGLHHDEWHSVTLTKTPSGNFSATLDGVTEWIQLNDGNIRGAAAELDKVESGTVSSVFVGGIKRRDGDNTGFSLNQYIGCIKNIQFSRDGHTYTTSDYVSTVGTKPGCIDQCEVHDDCKNGGECVNQYTGIICDCHGTGHEGAQCQNKGETTLTFYGSNFVEYFPYNASSTHHSSKNRVSLQFKMGTQDQDSGILFYNVGTPPNPNHLSISLINGRLNVSFDFGDEVYRLIDGSKLNDDSWHTVTVEHEEREVSLTLDGNTQSVDITGENYHLFMNPILYFGGGINMGRNQGLPTGENFVGCMKNVHVGSINVYELFLKNDKRVAHFGGEPSYGCNTIEFSPITFPTFKSQLILHSWQYPSDLKMSFQFRTQQRDALVLMVGIRVGNDTKTSGSIRLLLKNGRMQVHLDLSLEDGDDSFEYWTYAGKNLHDKEWHSCTIEAMLVDGEVTLQLDNEFVFIRSDRAFIRRRGGIYPVTDIYLGGGLHNQERGFVGCVRHLVIQGREVNPLETISSGEANGVILDGCKMKDLCVGVTKCEHQSECIQDWYQTYCDCDGTGYNGTVCHFPTAKRSCEDYYQMGFRQSGVRRIDPDGAGPLPPSYVYCEMLDQPIGYAGTKTIIDHNLRNSTLVRKFGQMNMKKVLEYRDMGSESLVHLVENSINCTQELTYECLKSPQYLGNQTWYLAANGKLFDTDAGFTKNCNKNDLKKRQDTAVLENPLHLPVTEMFFMQQRNKEEAEGRVSLSPLTCLGSKLYDPENAVTFTDESSNLMLDAWESGDLSFSFRTLQRDATLLFQEPPRHDSDYMMIEVVDGSSIIFKFNTGKREANATVRAKSLNDGNWHYVSVEYNQYHVRFTVDTVTSWINLIKDEEFGPFTGPLYVGGMSREYANVIPGLEGCFRNLVIDNKLIKLPDFIGIGVNGSSVTEGVKKECERSCDPDPCQNGAQCKELWGAYICDCADVSHRGIHCEEDYLADIVAFPRPDIFLQMEEDDNVILDGDIRFQFRTRQPDSLLLYANDNLGNFIQVAFLKNGKLEFKFNTKETIVLYLMDTNQDITNGDWQDVKILREESSTKIYLNDQIETIPISAELLAEYIPAPRFINEADNNVHQMIPPPSKNHTGTYTYIYLGGVDVAMIDTKDTDTTGLEGCLRAFFVDEVPYNLQLLSATNEEALDYCTPQCMPTTCLNGGVCKEKWDSYTCDCELTLGFKGYNCEIDVGANFKQDDYMMYKYNPVNSSTAANDDQKNDHLEFAFMANNGTFGVLAYVRGDPNDKEDEYIIVELSSDGYVYVVIDLGYGKEEFVGPRSFGTRYNDGQRHWFFFRRREDNIILDIDNTQKLVEKLKTKSENSLFNSRDAIVVGGIEDDVDKFGLDTFHKFEGCISEFMYNGIKPIDLAFGEDSSHIDIKDGVTKASCSDYVPPPVVVEPITTTPAAPTTIDPLHKALTFPPWDVEDADTVYLESENPEIGALESDGSLATVVVVILVVVFVVLLLAIVVTVHKMNKKDEKRKAAGYDKIPMKDIENGFGQPAQDQRPVEPPRTTEPPPPKPPHRNFRKLSEEESVPLKDAIVADSESSIADSEDDRLPIQPKDEELEWDPAGDITIVPDDPEHSPRPAGQPPTDPETSKGSEEHVQLHQQPIEMIDKESEPEPEAEKESEAEPEDDPKPEPEPEPEPEPDEVQLIQLEDDPEADLEWDDELSPEEQLMPHERLVSLEDSQLQDKPDEESEEEKTTEWPQQWYCLLFGDPIETTPLHIEEDEDTPPLIPSKDEVKYTPLENEPDDDEVDHRAPPTDPEQNSVDPEVEPVAEPEVESVAEPEEEPVDEPEEEEMVQADALEHLPPEHVSKQAELKTQEGVPEDVFVNDDDHANQSVEDDDVMPGEPAETADDHEVLTTPQRKKKKTRTSRRGSSISAQSSERV